MQIEDVEEPAQEERRTFLGRITSGEPFPMQWEIAAYAVLIVVAAALRFWDLGSRALHHDESLHATYSWYLSAGRGYRHDPMMHGPFQFHVTALAYYLLGASDYVSRLWPAIFGTVLVGLPWLLREHLGRAGALVTAGLLTISPAFLYYSRFARNDIYMAVWTLLTVVFMWRYLENRRPINLYLLAAVLSLSFAQKETAFIGVAIFGSFLFLLFLWDKLGPLGRLGTSTGLGHVAGEVLLAAGTLVLPLWIGGVKILERLPFGIHLPGPTEPLAITVYGTIFVLVLGVCALIGHLWNGPLWMRLAILFWAIYAVLYTTFLGNIAGIGTGIVGSLTYWLEQQGVKRGDQPGYYYYVLLSLYEFLPIIAGIAGIIYFRFRHSVFVNFLVYWTVLSFIMYSVAGEKMPWLSLHLALPLILLSGKLIGELLSSIPWRSVKPQFYFSVAMAGLLLVFVAAIVLTRDNRGLEIMSARQETVGVFVFLLGFVVLTAWLLMSLGVRTALKALAVAGLAVLLVFTVRTSVRASFQNGDTPVEMIVYTQSSPDVTLIYKQMEQLSLWKNGDKSLTMWIDGSSGFSWPWAWYLRDYKNAGYPSLETPGAPPTADLVIVHASNVDKMRPLLTGYTEGKRYRHRWWFPEGFYRDLTIPKFFAGLFDGKSWVDWGRYFVNRDMPEHLGPNPLGSEDGYIFFRRDLPSQPGSIR